VPFSCFLLDNHGKDDTMLGESWDIEYVKVLILANPERRKEICRGIVDMLVEWGFDELLQPGEKVDFLPELIKRGKNNEGNW